MRDFSLKFAGFITVIMGFGGALAAPVPQTARPSIITNVQPMTRGGAIRPVSAISNFLQTTTRANEVQSADCANPLPESVDAARCVSMYIDGAGACMRQDNTCGENFELCTTEREFNRVRIMCQDVLARCPADAIKSIFGNSVTVTPRREMCDGESKLVGRTFSPALTWVEGDTGGLAVAQNSMVDLAIKAGANWAAGNAVTVCKKKADACIRRACEENPWKCMQNDTELSDNDLAIMRSYTQAMSVAARAGSDVFQRFVTNMAWGESNVKAYLSEQCEEEIGSNRQCYIVAGMGEKPTDADLMDSYNHRAVFNDIFYSGAGARLRGNDIKIKEWTAQSALTTFEKCSDAIRTCSVNTCGDGSLARCYVRSRNAKGEVDIRNNTLVGSHTNIVLNCKKAIETDQNCVDVFGGVDAAGAEVKPEKVWEAVWDKDKTGAVAKLNQDLVAAFSAGRLMANETACMVATQACIVGQCGDRYQRCFRNRGDVYSDVTNVEGTGNDAAFNRSMNKVTGILDRTIIVGLCASEINNIKACKDHMEAEAARKENTATKVGNSWGSHEISSDNWWSQSASMNNAWTGVGSLTATQGDTLQYNSVDADGNNLCTSTVAGCTEVKGPCNKAVRLSLTKVCIPTEPVLEDLITFTLKQAENTLFSRAVELEERNAQAIFNAELTEQQTMCVDSMNQFGRADPVFQWSLLPTRINTADYIINGFGESLRPCGNNNTLQDCFCGVRMTIESSGNGVLTFNTGDGATGRIALGDIFEKAVANGSCKKYVWDEIGKSRRCGETVLEDECITGIEEAIREATAQEIKRSDYESFWQKNNALTSILTGVLGAGVGGVGGAYAGQGISGLLGDNGNVSRSDAQAQETKCANWTHLKEQKMPEPVSGHPQQGQNVYNCTAGTQSAPPSCTVNFRNATDAADAQLRSVATADMVPADATIVGGTITATQASQMFTNWYNNVCSDERTGQNTQSARRWGAGIGAVVVGGLTAWGTNQALSSAVDAKVAEARNKLAADQAAYILDFMNALKNTIKCRVGDSVVNFDQEVRFEFPGTY